MHSAASLPLLLILCSVSFFNVGVAAAAAAGEANGEENPFTPRAFLIRYWKKQISNTASMPDFLLNKSSPLTTAQSAAFSKLAADHKALAGKLSEFCAKANLLCFPDLSPSLKKHSGDVHIIGTNNQNFTSYGNDAAGGDDTFKKYSVNDNVVLDSFRRYSHAAVQHNEGFDKYASNSNVADQSFNTYGTSAVGGEGQFTNYNEDINKPGLRFTTYSDDANGRLQSFGQYTVDANAGDEAFKNYGKNANAAANDFVTYGKDANVIGSTFNSYGDNANAANDTFTSYGTNTNVPENTFINYGAGGNAVTESFSSYRDQANVGDDTFKSYIKNSNVGNASFSNYGQSFNLGSDQFSGYGKGSSSSAADFKLYGRNTTFADYKKQGTKFASYKNDTVSASMTAGGKRVNISRFVEPGKFFRESMLKPGQTMPMPDIRDKMVKRSFLPRTIISKLPFSTSKINDIRTLFHAVDVDSIMSRMLTDTLADCKRAPSQGETKRCVASIEDMIDFATSVLGRNVVVRTTENTRGYNSQILLGEVRKINGGKVTKSVSCHQSMYAYLVYYCHSVPKVRVYEADILDLKTKLKINHGVAICHLDTQAWSPTHGAFIALGSGPGKIEVCHWIFENDMTWAIAD